MSMLQVLVVVVVLAFVSVSCSPIIDPGPNERGERPEFCVQPMAFWQCTDRSPRFFYNRLTSNCERFNSGVCGANSNNFGDLRSCQMTCMREELKELPTPPEEDLFKLFP